MSDSKSNSKNLTKYLGSIYEKRYKLIVITSISIFLILMLGMFIKYSTTGVLLKRDISLKGGVVITIPFDNPKNFDVVFNEFKREFPNKDFNLRILGAGSKSLAVESSDLSEKEILGVLSRFDYFKKYINNEEYTTVTVGAVFGESFFKETLRAIIFSFILMSIIVLLYFRNFIPSLFVAWNAFSDIIETLAVLSIFNIKLSTASIAALLMLIGYSVDTNILLTSRVLKSRPGEVVGNILNSLRTGVAMSLTTIITTTLAFFLSQSLVIKQIMLIITIGLLFDTFNTWFFNAGLLRWYLELKHKKGH